MYIKSSRFPFPFIKIKVEPSSSWTRLSQLLCVILIVVSRLTHESFPRGNWSLPYFFFTMIGWWWQPWRTESWCWTCGSKHSKVLDCWLSSRWFDRNVWSKYWNFEEFFWSYYHSSCSTSVAFVCICSWVRSCSTGEKLVQLSSSFHKLFACLCFTHLVYWYQVSSINYCDVILNHFISEVDSVVYCSQMLKQYVWNIGCLS